MDKVKATISYVSDRVVTSRYGATRQVETVVRWCEPQELDDVVEQFRAHHEIVEVHISR
jgi:hypothetical protein